MSFGSEQQPPEPEHVPLPHRLPLVGIALGLGVLVGVGLGFALWRVGAQHVVEERKAPMASREVVASVERQIAARRLSAFIAEPLDPLDHPGVVLEGFAPPRSFLPPHAAIDATVFDTGEGRVKLADVWPVGRKEVCMGPNEVRFACGLMARASLQNHIAGKTVVCTPRFQPVRAGERATIVADCTVEGRDLASHMVEAGFAFPAGEAAPARSAALDAARAGKRGVWAGHYDLPDRDRALDDIAATSVEAPAPIETGSAEPIAVPPQPSPTPAAARSDKRVAPIAADARPAKIERRGPPEPTRRATPATAPAASVPSLEKLAPNAKPDNPGGVIAGPIMPPPPGLAEKLGQE